MRLRYLAPLAMAAAAATIGLAPVAAPHRRGRAPPPATRPCASGPAMSISSARHRWFPARSTYLSHIRCTPYSLDAEHTLTLELAQATTAYWEAAVRRGGHSLARPFAEASWGAIPRRCGPAAIALSCPSGSLRPGQGLLGQDSDAAPIITVIADALERPPTERATPIR